jgi:anti-sigma regulatory factor (Ser/Thr protein kinase)
MNSESHESAPAIASLIWWRRFPSTPRTVTLARHATRTALTGWGIESGGVADTALVVSELVTNAVRHGRVLGRLVELRLEFDMEKAVTVEVSDAGDRRPPQTAGHPADVALAESGRGLALVAAFADAWGVRERVVGKTVWARLLVTPGARPHDVDAH